jgi:hypothetical protein
MNSRLQMAREVLATLDSLGILAFIKDGKLMVSAPSKLDPLLASNCRKFRDELVELLAQRNGNGSMPVARETKQTTGTAMKNILPTGQPAQMTPPPSEITRCRWCGRDPRLPPPVAEQIRRLREWQQAHSPVWQWTEAQLAHLANRMAPGDEIDWTGYLSIIIRCADGTLAEVYKTDS